MRTSILMAFVLSISVVSAGCTTRKQHQIRAVQSTPPATPPSHTISAYSMEMPDRQYTGASSSSSTRVYGASAARESSDSSRGRYGVTIQEIEKHVRNGTGAIVDARGSQAFAKGHVRGAYNIPSGHEDEYIDRFMQEVAPDHPVVVYCSGSFCPAADHVYDYLVQRGFKNVHVFKQGWLALERDEQVK